MKRKSLFLLGAILAGSALVGGTFAAWAVTDNADPFNIKITPGTIHTGSNTYVTLEYGTKELINVEGLQAGQTVGPYRLGVRATVDGAESFSRGVLSLQLSGVANETLINYVTVQAKTYEIVPNEEDPVETLQVTLNKNNLTGTYKPTLPSGTEKLVYFYVTLDTSAKEVYSTIKDQQITLSVDWGHDLTPSEIVTSETYYFNNTAGWEHVYAYAFGDSGEAKAWPGVEMTNVKGNIYSIDIDNGYTKVVFNAGDNNDQHKTADLTLDKTKPYWDGDSWEVKPDLSAETLYYLVGTMCDWTLNDSYKFTAEEGTVDVPQEYQQTVGGTKFSFKYKLLGFETSTGCEVKVAGNDNSWYGEGSNEGNAPNMNLGAGHYDLYFNPSKSGNVYIFAVWTALS